MSAPGRRFHSAHPGDLRSDLHNRLQCNALPCIAQMLAAFGRCCSCPSLVTRGQISEERFSPFHLLRCARVFHRFTETVKDSGCLILVRCRDWTRVLRMAAELNSSSAELSSNRNATKHALRPGSAVGSPASVPLSDRSVHSGKPHYIQIVKSVTPDRSASGVTCEVHAGKLIGINGGKARDFRN